MVLTDRQRTDLHAGIYEYLVSRGPDFADVAKALAAADPDACQSKSNDTGDDASKTPPNDHRMAHPCSKRNGPPSLRVLDLEKQLAANAKHHAHRNAALGIDATADMAGGGSSGGRERRFLPRQPCTHTLQSHSAGISALSVHPVYTMTASGSEDGTIKLWDYESGDYMRTLRGHTNVVTGVDFSPSGMYLVSCSTDLSVKIWEVKDSFGCVRTLRGHDHTVSDVRFVPPALGAIYLNGGGEKTGGGGVDAASAQAKFVVTASRDGTVKFWDLETGFCDATVSDHGDWVRCLAVRGARGSAGGGEESKESDAADGAENATDSLALVASSGNDRTIYVYNAYDKREKVAELRGHDHVVESLSFLCTSMLPQERKISTTASARTKSSTSSPWDYLASASRDRTVRLWSVSNGGSCLMTFRAHENWVRGVLVHPSGNYVLSCGDDRSIRVFDVKSNRCLRTIEEAHPHFVTCITMHHTLPIMISGGVDNSVKCWQLD
eukprot:CCRYP_017041-RA/>CCRYP_017041-RA protein AED:0.14 eAED:0.15 QI:0/0/0/1/0.5/0.33/3/0/493